MLNCLNYSGGYSVLKTLFSLKKNHKTEDDIEKHLDGTNLVLNIFNCAFNCGQSCESAEIFTQNNV